MGHLRGIGEREGALAERDVTLHLDEFGHKALDSFVRRRRDSRSAAVRTASLYYLADREAKRTAWKVPQFAKVTPSQKELPVRLDDETWQALVQEADRQAVPPNVLLAHAVIYFLSDLDSGRLAERMEDALHDGEKL
jgi:hypothetical protein